MTLDGENRKALILSHFMCGFGRMVQLVWSDARMEEEGEEVKCSTYGDSTVPTRQTKR